MDDQFIQQYKNIVSHGLIDDRYPLDHTCVQLPNGWYGINSILSGFQNILSKYEYDEILLPTISTSAVFKDVPEEIKENIDQQVFTITHAGLHKLDDPLYLSYHPELIAPQVQKYSVRSYRDLPIRLVLRYFRYATPKSSEEIPLITDNEYPALDAEGIFATEEEYKSESAKVISDFNEFLEKTIMLSYFTARTKYSLVYYTILPNSRVLEIARMNFFDRVLAEKIGFQILESNNKFASPFIFDFNITSKIFAAIVIAHSVQNKVILPAHCMRTFGTSYGVDVSKLNFKIIRVESSRFPYTPERFNALIEQGGIFALKPTEKSNIICIVTKNGEITVEKEELEEKLIKIINDREKLLKDSQNQHFAQLHRMAVKYLSKDSSIPDGYTILGTKEKDDNIIVIAKPLFP